MLTQFYDVLQGKGDTEGVESAYFPERGASPWEQIMPERAIVLAGIGIFGRRPHEGFRLESPSPHFPWSPSFYFPVPLIFLQHGGEGCFA